MQSIVCNAKRLIVARFDEGEDLLLTLKKCALDHGIMAAWFNAIGGLKEFAYGLYEHGAHKTVRKKTKSIFELLSAFGNVSIKEGDVLIHAHIAAADEEGLVRGGHLVEGSIICPFAEVFIQECDAAINREYDPVINLWKMSI